MLRGQNLRKNEHVFKVYIKWCRQNKIKKIRKKKENIKKININLICSKSKIKKKKNKKKNRRICDGNKKWCRQEKKKILEK